MNKDNKIHAETFSALPRELSRVVLGHGSISVGTILLAMLGVILAGWMSVAGALYFWFKIKHEYEDVTYAKMVALPSA